jgi:iron complex outermembrane recepter protein
MPRPLFTTKPLTSVIGAITLGVMLLTSLNTWAQEEQEASEKPEMPVKRLNTVKVSADVESSGSHLDYLKKENDTGALGNKTVLDTPFSITVVDSDEIIERGAKSIGQIFVNDASVYAPTPSAQTDWWGTQIRGLPVRNFYVDDVPMLLYWGGDFPTEAAESVTALKGLTGFMYGFGEPGGAISYKIKKPTENPETFLNLGYRNPGLFSAHVDTSHNIGDEFAFRTNVATEQGTSYNESETDRTLVSLSLDKNFGESVKWLTNLIYEDSTLEAEPLQFYFSKYNAVSSNGKLPKINYDYDDLNVDNSYYHTETRILSTGVEWELSENWKLQYKIGVSRKIHQSNKSFAYLLNRQGDYEGYSYNFAGQLDNLFNQAILQGTISTGDIAHELVAGIGQQTSKEKWGTDWYWVNDFNGNIHQEQTFRITRTPDFSLESKPSLETDQSYAFASDTIHFNENWQAIIGLRFTDHKIKGTDFSTNGNPP